MRVEKNNQSRSTDWNVDIWAKAVVDSKRKVSWCFIVFARFRFFFLNDDKHHHVRQVWQELASWILIANEEQISSCLRSSRRTSILDTYSQWGTISVNCHGRATVYVELRIYYARIQGIRGFWLNVNIVTKFVYLLRPVNQVHIQSRFLQCPTLFNKFLSLQLNHCWSLNRWKW